MSLRCCWLRDAPQWVCSNCDDIVYRSILHITNRNNTTRRERRPDTARLLLITPFDTISPFFTCLLLGAAHCTELTITPDHNQGQWQYIMRLTSTWNKWAGHCLAPSLTGDDMYSYSVSGVQSSHEEARRKGVDTSFNGCGWAQHKIHKYLLPSRLCPVIGHTLQDGLHEYLYKHNW